MRLPSDGEPSQRSQSARWSKFNFPHQRSSSWTINYIFGVILHFHKNFWSGWGVRRIAFSLTMIDIKGGEDLDQPVKVGLGVPGAQPPQAAHLPPHPHSRSPFTPSLTLLLPLTASLSLLHPPPTHFSQEPTFPFSLQLLLRPTTPDSCVLDKCPMF